jgi:transposase
MASLVRLVEQPPSFDRWGRSNWTAALLARAQEELTGILLHFTWVWQLLRRSGYRWKRTRPIVRACNPVRRWQWARLVRVLWQIGPGEVLLFADEVDIDLNPKTGHLWCRRGVPAEIETPGRNQKRFLAGALNVDTGHFLWVEAERKKSALFVKLLQKISRSYRYATRIHLLLDNYSIHDSWLTRSALAVLNHRIRLHFLPRYSPEYNPVERIWGVMHDAVTRNHRCRTMACLMRAVHRHLSHLGRCHLQSPLPFRVTRFGLVVSDAK